MFSSRNFLTSDNVSWAVMSDYLHIAIYVHLYVRWVYFLIHSSNPVIPVISDGKSHERNGGKWGIFPINFLSNDFLLDDNRTDLFLHFLYKISIFEVFVKKLMNYFGNGKLVLLQRTNTKQICTCCGETIRFNFVECLFLFSIILFYST